MNLLELAAALCRRFEGLYLSPYLCPAGVPTIGYGATFYEDGTPVTLKDPAITKERAEQLLQHTLRQEFLPGVMRACPDLTENEAAALLDFAFNVGLGALRASTLRRRVNEGKTEEAANEFLRWNKAGGVVLRGLTRRRVAERELFVGA